MGQKRQRLVLVVIFVATTTFMLLFLSNNDIGTYLTNWNIISASWMSDLSEWEGMSVEEAIRRRRERVRRVCKKLKEEEHNDSNVTLWPGNYKKDSFFVVQKYKLGYCENAKVGCSTWKHHLLSLTPLPAETIHEMTSDVHTNALKFLSPFTATYHTKLYTFPTFIKHKRIFMFSMVRHPFERLVSAYEDKILNHGPGREKHFDTVVKHIGTDFRAFAEFVIKDTQDKGCNDFGCDVNIHYRPYFARCAYCSIDYNVIAKMETFSRDAEYIFSAVGAIDNKNLASLLFRRHNTTIGGGSTKESKIRTKEYFSSLDEEVKQALLKLYWLDFEMFGYSAEEYM